MLTMQGNDSLLRIDMELNGQSISTEFAGEAELGRARSLFDQSSGENPPKLTIADSILLDKFQQMVNFVDENQIDFNNLETYLASTLITDEDFIIAIPKSDQVMPFQMCGIIGDIAGIASLSCFLGPVAAAVCVPATGIATACAIAGILSRIFD